MADTFDVAEVLAELARQRPIFHSEADFQLALAWTLQAMHPTATVRLEKRMLDEPRVVVDVLAIVEGERLALELKYLRSKADVTVDGERFVLSLGAADVGLRHCQGPHPGRAARRRRPRRPRRCDPPDQPRDPVEAPGAQRPQRRRRVSLARRRDPLRHPRVGRRRRPEHS
jgi:hypothetical protein